MTAMTAAQAGLLSCRTCGLLLRRPAARGTHKCVRCGTGLSLRKPDSIARTWALLIAACVLYIPANMLPVLETGRLGRPETSDTILGGAIRLWHDGAWPLSLVIIVASIGVPLGKMIALTWLLVTVQARLPAGAARRAHMYRIIDFIGRWSMVDIYVGGLMVALVQFQPLATISPGPGAVAFGAVVVLTMFASRSFDPRLVWDSAANRARHG